MIFGRLAFCAAGFNVAIAALSYNWHAIVGWTLVSLFLTGAIDLS